MQLTPLQTSDKGEGGIGDPEINCCSSGEEEKMFNWFLKLMNVKAHTHSPLTVSTTRDGLFDLRVLVV